MGMAAAQVGISGEDGWHAFISYRFSPSSSHYLLNMLVSVPLVFLHSYLPKYSNIPLARL